MTKSGLLFLQYNVFDSTSTAPQADVIGVDLHSLFSFEKKQLSIPGSAAKALHKLHAALCLQMFPSMLRYIAVDLKTLEVVKVGAAKLP